MEPETLIFMPNGDVTLTLIRHVLKEEESPPDKPDIAPEQKPFDEDEELDAALGIEPETPAGRDESFLFFAPEAPGSENGPLYPPTPRAMRGSDASSRRDRSSSPPASFWASLKRQAARATETIEEEPPVNPPKPAKKQERIVLSSHEVRCVVSSRHMILASQFFETILSGNSNEAIALRTKGHVSISMSANLDAMIILLNIVHGASRKVPRQVNLEELTQLAVLVSSFGMLETVQFFSDTWVDSLQREGLAKSYSQDVFQLLYVFWVFDRASEFKNMTRLAQRECDENLAGDVGDVPIPHSIIDAIKRDREFAIETALTVIHALITRYMDGQTICDYALDDELRYACDAMVLGSLMKSSRKIGIWPIPEAPFSGRKFKDLAQAIRSIRILDVCNKSSTRRSTRPSSNCHGLEDSIEASMKSIEAGLDGLELSDYASKGDDYLSGLQMFVPTPSQADVTDPKAVETKNDSQTYSTNEVIEAPKEDIKTTQRVYPTQDSGFLARISSSDVVEPPQKEIKASPKQRPKEINSSRVEAANSPRINVLEAEVRATKEIKEALTHPTKEVKFQQREARFSPKASTPEVEAPVQEGVKVEPRRYSREFQREEAQPPPKFNGKQVAEPVKEERKVTTSDSLRQEIRNPSNGIARPADEPRKEDVKPTQMEEVKVLGDRKLNRTTSFPKIPTNEVKLPMKESQVAPRVASIEEIEEILRPQKEEIKSSTVEAKETVREVPAPTDEDDILAPAQNFKMRKSKKKFSTRF